MRFSLSFTEINNSGFSMPAYFIDHPAPAGAILVFHGFKSTKDFMVGLGVRIAREGFSVLIPDQRGAGENKNNLDINFFLDLHLCLEYLKDFSLKGIVGYSLNGFTALFTEADAIVAISPPDENIIKTKAQEYNIPEISVKNLGTIFKSLKFNEKSPKLILYGENESEEYIEAAKNLNHFIPGSELKKIGDACHNNICYKEEVLNLVPQWLKKNLSGNQ